MNDTAAPIREQGLAASSTVHSYHGEKLARIDKIVKRDVLCDLTCVTVLVMKYANSVLLKVSVT